jgi:polyisoprenoid-binding protein YceI
MTKVLIASGLVVALLVGIWVYSSWSQEQSAVVLQDGEAVTGRVTMKTIPVKSDQTMVIGTYKADIKQSEIDWEAGKPAIAGYVHHGTFGLRSGEVTLVDDKLTGEFLIDVDSLKVTSLGGGKAGQESALEGHLKGERFFDVANNPTATFKITKVEPQILPGPGQAEYTATGELTMKGKTNEVTFPMKVVVDGDEKVYVTANLEIDRTKWGIDFGSATVAEKITENIIGDSVKLDLQIWLAK